VAQIKSGASTDILTIDVTSKAARGTPYDTSGNALAVLNRAAVTETAGGVLNSGKDYKLARTLRASATGTLRTADETLFLYDSFEGTARNSTTWIETVATMTSAQTLATGLRLNTTASVTTAQGCLETSHRQFPIISRSSLVFRARLRVQGLTNCFEEFGFGAPTDSTTAVINNGAFFRRDGAGSLQGILSFNGTEGAGPTMTAPATTQYAWYEIFLEDDRATFQIIDVNGVLISSSVLERGSTGGSGTGVATQARLFAVTHLPCFFRTYNSGAAGTAPQIDVTECSVISADLFVQRDYKTAQSGNSLNSLTSPTAYTQLANWTNNAAPTTRTLSNTAAAETTLGGLLRVNSIAGGNNDLIMFGWQNPSPYTFYVTGIKIPVPLNEVVAVATTATMFAYFASFNLSAVSLATGGTYPGFRVGLGEIHTAAVGLAANALFSGNTVVWTPQTPMAVMPGRFFHICCREFVGTITATETYFWGGIAVDGFFE
jgi:hypothetical protein